MGHHHLTRRILIPLDGSELATIAIPWARALSTPETELVLVRVIPDPTPMSELAGTSAFPIERVIARNRHVADDYLEAVADVLGDTAPVISTASVVGDPSEAILKVIGWPIMIVLVPHARPPPSRVSSSAMPLATTALSHPLLWPAATRRG